MKLLIVDANGKEDTIFIDFTMKIGEGATALIYKANISNELWAAKIYKPERVVPAEKLEAMLQTPPENINIIHDNQVFIQYTWVKYLLKDIKSKKIVGFIMPIVDQDSTNSLDSDNPNPVPPKCREMDSSA
jgi:DNA-binding helix-hairpin-helix protein with protein kinase domain